LSKTSPYNFGISQEDAITEFKALELKTGDSLLCIASSGEIPLNLLALSNIKVIACDMAIEQIYLSKIKLAAILHLKREEAAKLIGFYSSDANERVRFYKQLQPYLTADEIKFWNENIKAIGIGVINAARYEKYILKFSWIFRLFLGKRKLLKLMKFKTIKEQQKYFDRKISSWWIKLFFKIGFHPKIYKNRGMDEHGLQHQKDASIATFFYNRFRDFCTSTIAFKNYYFQYTFFNKVLNESALPEYLSETGVRNIKANIGNLSFVHKGFTSSLLSYKKGTFNKYHLSNIGDWLSEKQMQEVFEAVHLNSSDSSKLVIRYLHRNHPIPEKLKENFKANLELREELEKVDRYPFYNILPLQYKRK